MDPSVDVGVLDTLTRALWDYEDHNTQIRQCIRLFELKDREEYD